MLPSMRTNPLQKGVPIGVTPTGLIDIMKLIA